MNGKALVTRMMNEVIDYGGLPLRRCDAYVLACEHMGERAHQPFGADWFAFSPAPLVDVEPWPLDKAREIMRS